MACSFFGIRFIEESLADPIENTAGAMCSLLCVIFLGETIGLPVWIAIGIILVGIIFTAMSLIITAAQRGSGNTRVSMVTNITANIVNVIFNYLLIGGNLGFPRLGIAGAALATIISQFVSFCILLRQCSKGGNLSIHYKNFTPSWGYMKLITQSGLPSLGRQGLASLATICLNRAAGPYGDAAIAAMGVVQRISMFGGSAMIGFGQGFQPVCGFNYGAKLYERVLQGFWFCVKVAVSFLVCVSILGFIFAPNLIALFRNDPQVIAYGATALRLQCVTFTLMGWIVMSNMMTQSMGLMIPATFLAVARQGLFFIPLVLVLPLFLDFFGVQITQSVADILTFCCAVPIQAKVIRNMKKAIEIRDAG